MTIASLRDSVEWTEEQEEEAAAKVAANSATPLLLHEVDEFEQKAGSYWDRFYETHRRDFFKDRHWLFTEFSELLGGKREEPPSEEGLRILEVGCGVGNTVFPILEMNLGSQLLVYACDFSSVAIDLLKQEKSYDESRCHAFVMDATESTWNAVPFEEASLDVVILIFTLSAMDPAKARGVLASAYRYLKPGGVILFRDYGRHDMAQLRFKTGHCLGDNFYVRGDGTRAYFFTEDEVHELMSSCGFQKKELFVDRRLQVNRGKRIRMFRVWIQAKYQKPASTRSLQ